jgi:voltage-gated potassium channel
MLNDDVENIYITLNAKSVNRDIYVIARATNENVVKKYKRAGADEVLLPSEVTSSMMSIAILNPVMYEVINTIFIGKNSSFSDDQKQIVENRLDKEDYLVDEVLILEESKIRDLRVEDVDFQSFKLILFGVQKKKTGEFIFNPPLDTVLELGDILLLFGHHISVKYFRDVILSEKIRGRGGL